KNNWKLSLPKWSSAAYPTRTLSRNSKSASSRRSWNSQRAIAQKQLAPLGSIAILSAGKLMAWDSTTTPRRENGPADRPPAPAGPNVRGRPEEALARREVQFPADRRWTS